MVQHGEREAAGCCGWPSLAPRPSETSPALAPQAVAALESPASSKDEQLAAHAAHVLGACALKYDQLEVGGCTAPPLPVLVSWSCRQAA